MSLRPSSAHLADLRHHIQLLIEQSAEHEDRLEELVASAGRDHWAAEGLASQAASSGASPLASLLRDSADRAATSAVTASQLCRGARQQHQAICELLGQLDAARAVKSTNAVLVVDDYGDVREAIATLLRDEGFIVRTAANGLEGLLAASEMRPSVIVMDLAMPVLGGLEATRLIKANEPTRDARVIAYTGETKFDTLTAQNLFAAILHKPATPGAVLATVQHVASLCS